MTPTTPDANMSLFTSNWGPLPTFRLMPVRKDCPYLECIYDVQNKVLAVLSTNLVETFKMVPKLDDNGQMQLIKQRTKQSESPDPSDPKSKYKQQRQTITSPQEFYIRERKEIEDFINMFAINAKDFDYDKHLNFVVPEMDNPANPMAIVGPDNEPVSSQKKPGDEKPTEEKAPMAEA